MLLSSLFVVVMSIIGKSYDTGANKAEQAIKQMNSTLNRLADAVSEVLILGEEDIIETPSLQGNIGKVEGNALGNSTKRVGKSSLQIANISLDGCHVYKVRCTCTP